MVVAFPYSECFSLKEAVESLSPYRSLYIPPGNYTSAECGMEIRVDNVLISASFPNVVIDCFGTDRHFTIRGSNVTIEGLLLMNGASQAVDCEGNHLGCHSTKDGGCVLIHGNNTKIQDSAFLNCWAAGHGGAISIANMSAAVSLKAISISQSKAAQGGGIWSRGTLVLYNCSLTFNNASLDGGGIYIQGPGAFLTARRTIIGNNTAYSGCGGGIAMMVRNVSVTDCPVQELVTLDGGSVLLDDCQMHKNWAASWGGAIFLQDRFVLLIEGKGNGTQLGMNAASRGGAIFALFSHIAISGNATFAANSAVGLGDGGALYLRCSCHVNIDGDILFENNTSFMEYEGYGGAMLVSDSTLLEISGNVSFVSNQALAGYGGAIFLQKGAVCNISGNFRFVQNLANGGGAMSLCFGGTVYFSGDVQFLDNEAQVGGALDVESASLVSITGRMYVAGNRCVPPSSVVEYFTGTSLLWATTGGAVYTQFAYFVSSGNFSLENNTADQGGAIFASGALELTLSGSASFRNCSATSGGAFFIQSSSILFKGETRFEGNVAESGGGMFVRSVFVLLAGHRLFWISIR